MCGRIEYRAVAKANGVNCQQQVKLGEGMCFLFCFDSQKFPESLKMFQIKSLQKIKSFTQDLQKFECLNTLNL